MNILVTGGLGLIGGALVEELRSRGHEVWLCDLSHHHDPKYVRCDVGSHGQIEALFDSRRFDLVYHLAAEYGRWNGEDYYDTLWRSNVIGTKNVLRMQEKHGFKMVFASSSEVYGDCDEVMSEDLMDRREIRQLNDYAIGKWVNELQIMNSAAMHRTETVRVRLFNTYGPGEFYSPYRSAICQFIYCGMFDLPYTVYLNHRRTSIFISDTIRTLAAIPGRFSPGEVYNVGSDVEYDVKDYSDLILRTLGKTDRLVTYRDSEPFTTRNKKVSLERAERDLDHKVTVPLERGIFMTIDWMKSVYNNGRKDSPPRLARSRMTS